MPPTGLRQGLNFMGRSPLPGGCQDETGPVSEPGDTGFELKSFSLLATQFVRGQTDPQRVAVPSGMPTMISQKGRWSEGGVYMWQLTQTLSPVPPSATCPVAITQV